jgi:hypothetical protein
VYEHLHSRPKHPTVQNSDMAPKPEDAPEPSIVCLSSPPTRTHWIADEIVSNCTECTTRFTIFLRKHHCRKCGKIFCSECSKYTGKLDSNADFHLSGYICRLCISCYQNFLHSLDGQVYSEVGLEDSPSTANLACDNVTSDTAKEASGAVNISLIADQASPDQAEAVSPAVPSNWQWSTF